MTWPSLPQYLREKTARYGDRPFMCDFGTEIQYTYRQLDETTALLAGGLRDLGVRTGERVALLHPNHTDFIIAYFAIIKAGAVAVPINTLYSPREVQYVLQDCSAAFIISTSAFESLLKEVRRGAPELRGFLIKAEGEGLLRAAERECKVLKPYTVFEKSPDELAFIFYTSGTTGRPKGVMLTHRNLAFGGANTAQNYGLRESDVTIACLPLVHIFANASPVFGSLNSGGSVVVMERFQTEPVYQALHQHGVTWFPGVPTMYGFLLNAFHDLPRDLNALRMGLAGGASLSTEHLTRFESLFGAPILEVYGLTESTGLVTANPVFGVRKPGSIGVNVTGVSVRLVDSEGNDVPQGEVGELIFRGPNASPGYWNNPQATAAAIRNGWTHTGDLAWQDEEGYVFLVGRLDELIISGGYNIYPREIEEVLYMHEDVSEAAVIGVHDPHLGEVPKAYVSLKPGSGLTPEGVQDFCRNRLAPYKIPRGVEILRELPKNTTGKILKRELQK